MACFHIPQEDEKRRGDFKDYLKIDFTHTDMYMIEMRNPHFNKVDDIKNIGKKQERRP